MARRDDDAPLSLPRRLLWFVALWLGGVGAVSPSPTLRRGSRRIDSPLVRRLAIAAMVRFDIRSNPSAHRGPRPGSASPTTRTAECFFDACSGLPLLAAAALVMLPASQGFSQSHSEDMSIGDQPGLVPDESVQLPPQFQRQMVLYRTTEPPGTIIVHTSERFLYLVQGNGRRHSLRGCASAARDSSGRGPVEDHPQGRSGRTGRRRRK